MWHCLVERLQSANYRNFDLLINYPGDTEANSTDYDLTYGKRETLVAELDSAFDVVISNRSIILTHVSLTCVNNPRPHKLHTI